MPSPRPVHDQAVDLWVRDSLRASHAAILQEPVPDALLKLLRDDGPG